MIQVRENYYDVIKATDIVSMRKYVSYIITLGVLPKPGGSCSCVSDLNNSISALYSKEP